MPTGPEGQKRPADVIGNAVRVMRIATGEEADDLIDDGKDPAAMAAGMSDTLWSMDDLLRNNGRGCAQAGEARSL